MTCRSSSTKGYISLDRLWKSGDVIELNLPMLIRHVAASENVPADRGRIALQRGPIVFCAEWPDTPDGKVRKLLLPDDQPLTTRFDPALLNGVQVIEGKGFNVTTNEFGRSLQAPAGLHRHPVLRLGQSRARRNDRLDRQLGERAPVTVTKRARTKPHHARSTANSLTFRLQAARRVCSTVTDGRRNSERCRAHRHAINFDDRPWHCFCRFDS